jgi:hypothetical protein
MLSLFPCTTCVVLLFLVSNFFLCSFMLLLGPLCTTGIGGLLFLMPIVCSWALLIIGAVAALVVDLVLISLQSTHDWTSPSGDWGWLWLCLIPLSLPTLLVYGRIIAVR